MPTCFVIQPFDEGKYDKRYEDVFQPAIVAADLEPYRVDKDPTVEEPIEAIEAGIRAAVVCLADISTDNPNVWYELGFAFASGRPVVMVCCSEERAGRKYPFDIQHRVIIPYRAESPRDFDALQHAITERTKALRNRTDALKAIRETEQVAPIHGLTPPEMAVLAVVAGSAVLPDDTVEVYTAKADVERAGFTSLAFSLGLKRLREKQLVVICSETLPEHGEYAAVAVTPEGWDWIEHNEKHFLLRRPDAEPVDPDVPL
jgi:hypothetical protein